MCFGQWVNYNAERFLEFLYQRLFFRWGRGPTRWWWHLFLGKIPMWIVRVTPPTLVYICVALWGCSCLLDCALDLVRTKTLCYVFMSWRCVTLHTVHARIFASHVLFFFDVISLLRLRIWYLVRMMFSCSAVSCVTTTQKLCFVAVMGKKLAVLVCDAVLVLFLYVIIIP